MKLVKLTKPVGVRQPGEVLELDSASAAALVERGDAKAFDPSSDKVEAERNAPPRGNVTAVAVIDADIPVVPAVAEKPADEPEPTPAGEPNAESLTEVRARAVAAGKVTEDEAKKLTKAQLLDKLGE